MAARPLRIGMYVNDAHPMPPHDIILANFRIGLAIADGMARRGHEVTLFAAKGSRSRARVESFGLDPLVTSAYAKSIKHRPSDTEQEVALGHAYYDHVMLGKIYARLQEAPVDVFHHHQVERPIHYAPLVPGIPHLFTLHDPVTPLRKFQFGFYRKTPNVNLVSLSDRQREAAPELPWHGTIYNGIDSADYPMGKGGSRLLFAGRMTPEKGPHRAIEAARLARVPLDLYGPYDGFGTHQAGWWTREVKPKLGGPIRYRGYVPADTMGRLYGRSRGLLLPIDWEEPFGLVAIEAMATGTPVIGFRRGALPELIEDGVTGFLVDTVKQMASAIGRLDRIDRAACRRRIEARFSTERMLDGYERAYRALSRTA